MTYLDFDEVKFLMEKGFAPANYFPRIKFEIVAELIKEYAMRKLIDLPEDVYEKLQHICVDEKTNPKNFIEELVKREVKERGQKIK